MPDMQHLPKRGTVLGLDFGLARTGIAIGELETGIASALQTIHACENVRRFASLTQLIATWQPLALIVGLPCHLDGTPHEMTQRCQRFAHQLSGRYRLPVFTVDERLSSVAADQLRREASSPKKIDRDAVAAQLILQQFLDEQQHENSPQCRASV